MGGDYRRGEEIDGGFIAAEPRSAHNDAALLVECSSEIEDRGSGAERLAPVPEREALCSAKEGEVGAIECLTGEGLNEGDLVSNLIQLAL